LLAGLSKGTAPTVILLDDQLPGLSGIETISAVKARSPTTVIIVLANFPDQDSIIGARCAGASATVLKTSVENIGMLIDEVLS
jgi:DNA-binding NarL/FixJ family response regulator